MTAAPCDAMLALESRSVADRVQRRPSHGSSSRRLNVTAGAIGWSGDTRRGGLQGTPTGKGSAARRTFGRHRPRRADRRARRARAGDRRSIRDLPRAKVAVICARRRAGIADTRCKRSPLQVVRVATFRQTPERGAPAMSTSSETRKGGGGLVALCGAVGSWYSPSWGSWCWAAIRPTARILGGEDRFVLPRRTRTVRFAAAFLARGRNAAARRSSPPA